MINVKFPTGLENGLLNVVNPIRKQKNCTEYVRAMLEQFENQVSKLIIKHSFDTTF